VWDAGANVRYILTCPCGQSWLCRHVLRHDCVDTWLGSRAASSYGPVGTGRGSMKARRSGRKALRYSRAAPSRTREDDGNHGQHSRNETAVACANESRFDGRVSATARGVSSQTG
jgi:hypothetical protein